MIRVLDTEWRVASGEDTGHKSAQLDDSQYWLFCRRTEKASEVHSFGPYKTEREAAGVRRKIEAEP
jgi:hypothetical protein